MQWMQWRELGGWEGGGQGTSPPSSVFLSSSSSVSAAPASSGQNPMAQLTRVVLKTWTLPFGPPALVASCCSQPLDCLTIAPLPIKPILRLTSVSHNLGMFSWLDLDAHRKAEGERQMKRIYSEQEHRGKKAVYPGVHPRTNDVTLGKLFYCFTPQFIHL